jgi:hypothetical protein
VSIREISADSSLRHPTLTSSSSIIHSRIESPLRSGATVSTGAEIQS